MSTLTTLGMLSAILVIWFTWWTYTGGDVAGGGQSRRESIIEAWTNIAIGFTINFAVNIFLLPLVGAHFGFMENIWLGWTYTAISIIRSYTVRRWFNARIHNFAARAAERLS